MYEYQPPFNITNEIIDYISKIMEKIGNIDNYKDLDRLPRLRKQNRIRSIYSSCAIEANSLSLSEVTDIVNGKTVVGDETEIKEVKNAIEAYDLIEQIDPYSLKNLLEIHKIIANNLISNSGTLRSNAEGVFDGDRCIFIAPPSNMVPHLMESLFAWMKENQGKIHPLLLSCIFHYEFVFIHPFKDGNGRMARLWQTALLGKYKPIFYWMPIENYIKDFVDQNPIDNFNYEEEALLIKDKVSDKRKLQDALLVLNLMKGPMELVFLVKDRLKKYK